MADALYESIVEESGDGIFVAQDGEVVYVNEQLQELTGYAAEALVGSAKTKIVAPPDKELVERHHRERMAGNSPPSQFEVELETSAGDRTPVELSVSRITYEGDPASVSFCRDITERKERERELERARTRLRMLFDEAPDAMLIHDADGEILDINEQSIDSLGYAREELTSMNVTDFEVGIDAEEIRRRWTEMDVGETIKLEGEHERKDGSTYPVEVWATKIDVHDDPRYLALSRDITERKERERALQQFREAVEQTGHVVYITDADGTIEYVNPAFEDVTGYSGEEALGRTPRILNSGAYDEEFYDKFWDVIQAGEQWEEEMIDQRADGERVVLHQTVSPISDGEGEPRKYVAVAQDITQRKEYERALERSREELRQIIDLVPDLIFAKNRHGEYLLANEATAEMYGLTTEEIEGSHESEVIPNVEESEQFREDDLEVIESGEPKFIPEEQLTTAEGETRILQTTKIPYTVLGSGEDAVLGYARDVTELKEYEREISSERDFFDSVIESLPYPFYVINVDDYTIEYANSEAIVQEGETCYEATHENDVPCDEAENPSPCPIVDVQQDGEPITVEHVHPDDEGDEQVFRVHASPIFDDEGTLVQMAESNIDITDRVEYERQLEAQRDNLEVLNQVVRHDIRNDLQLVLAYTETLRTYVEDGGEEYVDQVLEAARAAVDITETARDVTSIMLQSDVDRSAVSLRHVLEEQIDDVRSGYEHAFIALDGSIPDVDVLADDMLASVFRNLLNNAVQHNDKEVPEVTVSATVRDDDVLVRIADNGPGIPDDRKRAIFEQGEMGLDSEGTGLGLYLVETLVDRYNGDVRVEDNDPEGAVFVVSLPLAE